VPGKPFRQLAFRLFFPIENQELAQSVISFHHRDE
jgi:hypothetical protein